MHSEPMRPADRRTWRIARVAGFVTAAAACAGTVTVSPGQSPNANAGTRGHRTSIASVAILRDSVRALLDQARIDSTFPGALAVIGNRDSVFVEYGVGSLDWAPSPRPDGNTLWDMAS